MACRRAHSITTEPAADASVDKLRVQHLCRLPLCQATPAGWWFYISYLVRTKFARGKTGPEIHGAPQCLARLSWTTPA